MNDFERINELKKLKNIATYHHVSLSDLALKDEDGKTFFEYIVLNKVVIDDESLIDFINSEYELLQYATLNHYYLEYYNNVHVLFKDNDTSFIEDIFKNNGYRFAQLISLNILHRLFEFHNGQYLIEKFLDIDSFNCHAIIYQINDFDLLYDCFSKINRLDLMKYANERCLLSKTPDGISMVEELIAQNETPFFVSDFKDSVSLAEIFYKHKKYDLLLRFDCELLLNYPSPSHSYFQSFIDDFKNGEEVPFQNISLNSDDPKSLAICLMSLLKERIDFLKPSDYALLSEYDDRKSAIFHMLEMNEVLTFEKIIKNTHLESRLQTYVSRFCDFSAEEIEHFDIHRILDYLSKKKENTISQIKKKEKTKIEKKDFFIDDFVKPMEGDGISLLEYALIHHIDLADVKYQLFENFDAVLLLQKYHHEFLNGIFAQTKEKFLYQDVFENKKLIDLLFESHYFDCIRASCKKDLRILDYCVKYHNFSVLNYDILQELLASKDGKYAIEKYLVYPDFLKDIPILNFKGCSSKINIDDLFKLYDKGYKNIFINASESILLTSYHGMTLLEDMLKEGISPSFLGYEFASVKTSEILSSYHRFDLMFHAKLELLVNFPNKDANYLQCLIDCALQNEDVHLERINYLSRDKEVSARAIMEMTKNGLGGYLNKLDEYGLTKEDKNGKSLLYYLILLDKDYTLNHILTSRLKSKFDIYSTLKSLGVPHVFPNVSYDAFNCNEAYIRSSNEKYVQNMVSPVESLLEELRTLFKEDGKSDKELIEALVTSYRYTTSVNPLFIQELKNLIEIKKCHPDFYYTKMEDGGYFSKSQGVVVENAIISTLNHETGHALHHYLAKDETPDSYESILSSITEDTNWLKKVESYSVLFHEIESKVKAVSQEKVSQMISQEQLQKNKEEILKMLSKSFDEKKKIYLEKGYSSETLDLIFSDSFTVEEFMEQKEKIEMEELCDSIMRCNYDAFIAIGDIIDAIVKGKFRSRLLVNEKNEVIQSAYGHGVRYYLAIEHGFDEMVANYSAIIKSKQCHEALQTLRNIVGDELVNLLDQFYNQKILEVKIYDQESYMTL